MMNNPAFTGLLNGFYGSYATLPIPPGEVAGAKPVDNKSAQTHQAVAPSPNVAEAKGYHVNTYG